MHRHEASRTRTASRVRPLTICLAGALASVAVPGLAVAPMPGVSAVAGPGHDVPVGQIHTVKNCSDHDPGSLRDIVENIAADGDTVDLGQLPALCGAADSVITLTTGEITAAQYTLTLLGPAPGTGTITVSGNGASRVLNHAVSYNPTAMLTISDLAFTGGYVIEDGYTGGGCIRSIFADVVLERVGITGCIAVSSTSDAAGGGIYAGILELTDSTISGNTVHAAKVANGGGAFAGTLESRYSSLSDNGAVSEAGSSFGGGASVFSLFVYHSTFDHNTAEYGSALNTRGYKPANIQNSTISGNTGGVGAIRAVSPDPSIVSPINYLRIANTTIAFNHSSRQTAVGAVYFDRASTDFWSYVTLESSIVAENTAGPANAPADVYVNGDADLVGHDNLVIASNISPPGVITVTSDPMLGPLQDNGGSLLTHALLPGSPAIGAGNANVTFPYMSNDHDQRGLGFPRSRLVGGVAITDIGAIQFDTLFADGFD